ALGDFPHRDQVSVRWRSFELDPDAPRVREGDATAALAAKYGISREEAAAFQRHMSEAAAGEGISFDLAGRRGGNTFDAHRLLHLAAEEGRQDALKERLLAAYLCEARPIGEPEVLAGLAGEVGLDPDRVRAVLATDAYGDQVRADEEEAAALFVTGVPFFAIDRTYAVGGAQEAAVLRGALERAWAKSHDLVRVGGADGPGDEACEGGSCAL
ncbi:MAG TPA: DsbA family oxidoreductase, partial [Acidimicrobiales bacterium]|nr:DsbA family oxidoreductase [Acidimicrobiales bacterium]